MTGEEEGAAPGQRRQAVRLEVTLKVRFTLLADEERQPELAALNQGEPLLGRIRDISAGGCLLVSETDLPPETTLDMEITFPDDRQLAMIGQVVRKVPPPSRAGPKGHWLAMRWVGGRQEREFITGFIFRELNFRRQRGLT